MWGCRFPRRVKYFLLSRYFFSTESGICPPKLMSRGWHMIIPIEMIRVTYLPLVITFSWHIPIRGWQGIGSLTIICSWFVRGWGSSPCIRKQKFVRACVSSTVTYQMLIQAGIPVKGLQPNKGKFSFVADQGLTKWRNVKGGWNNKKNTYIDS